MTKYDWKTTVKKGVLSGVKTYMATGAGATAMGFPVDDINTHVAALIAAFVSSGIRMLNNYIKNKNF